MGACRGLNLLLGMAHAPELGGAIAWFAAAAYGLYVAGITVISRSETQEGDRRGLVAGLIFQDLALLGLAAAAMAHRTISPPAPDRPLIPLEGILVIALIAMVVNQAAAVGDPAADLAIIQRTVKTGILSLVWLDVGLVAAVRGVEPAAIVAASGSRPFSWADGCTRHRRLGIGTLGTETGFVWPRPTSCAIIQSVHYSPIVPRGLRRSWPPPLSIIFVPRSSIPTAMESPCRTIRCSSSGSS